MARPRSAYPSALRSLALLVTLTLPASGLSDPTTRTLRVARADEVAHPLGGVVQRLHGSIRGPRAAEAERASAPFFKITDGDDELETLPLKSTRADVDIAGVIAQVKLTQIYKNEGEHTIEAVYVFPASTRAAVYAMKMTVGERVIRAKIQTRDQARKTYEQARQQGRTASLLEQQRPNVFQMSVANVLPGDEIEVELFYTELLVPEDHTYELVIPTVVGPRYVDGSEPEAGSADSWFANPHLGEGEDAPYTFGAEIEIRSGIPVAKVRSSHDVDVVYDSVRKATVSLFPDPAHGNRDLVLRYQLAGAQIQTGLLLYPGEEENFFLLTVEPPERIEAREIVPREFIFIMDVSGSMNGYPLETAKQLMRELLAELRPSDHFNVIFFAGQAALLSPRSLPVSRSSLRQAEQLVDMQYGGGGTALVPALERALQLPRIDDAERILVIATDGYVGTERRAFSMVRQKLGEASFFPFGIGSSVNRFLIEGLARAGQGEPFVVLDQNDAEAQAVRFRRYIQSPLLRDIEVEFDGFEAHDVEPLSFPTLFAQRPLVIFGKYQGRAEGQIVIRGQQASGDYLRRVEVAEGIAHEDNAALRHLWARKRIQGLADDSQLDRSGGQAEEVTRLGLKYSLLTEFTSFVAVDTVVRADGRETIKVRQPLPLPEGVSNKAAGEAFGSGGLGLRGTGAGGGGSAYGGGKSRSVGSIGTRGRGGGVGHGYGSGSGGLGGMRNRAIKITQGSPVIMGSLDKGIIQRVIRANMAQIRYCYERELARSPGLYGKVIVKFVIAATGRVSNAQVVETTMKNEALEQCLIKKVRSWRFPKPRGGGIVIVSYPFVFKQGG